MPPDKSKTAAALLEPWRHHKRTVKAAAALATTYGIGTSTGTVILMGPAVYTADKQLHAYLDLEKEEVVVEQHRTTGDSNQCIYLSLSQAQDLLKVLLLLFPEVADGE